MLNRRIRKEIDIISAALSRIDDTLSDYDRIGEEPTEEETDQHGRTSKEVTDIINWPTADEPAKDSVYMKDLRELTELKGLTIVGQIVTVFDLKSYVKSEGGAGLIYRFVISDKTGDMTVISFDDMATELKQYTIGQILKITNAWKMQENKHGKIELHVGNFAKVEVVE